MSKVGGVRDGSLPSRAPRPPLVAPVGPGCPGIDEAPGAIAQGALAQRCYPRKRGRTEVATDDQLLVVIDPLARRTDGEAVRIAKDVLSAGAASTKVCLPEGPEEFARALVRRGSRRPVVVGDDRALLRTVALLHRRRELGSCALSLIPVGSALGLAHSLGVPTGAVAAARAALDGVERRLDLLVDDSDGVVLGTLRIPVLPGTPLSPDHVDGLGGMDGTGPGREPGTRPRSTARRPASTPGCAPGRSPSPVRCRRARCGPPGCPVRCGPRAYGSPRAAVPGRRGCGWRWTG